MFTKSWTLNVPCNTLWLNGGVQGKMLPWARDQRADSTFLGLKWPPRESEERRNLHPRSGCPLS